MFSAFLKIDFEFAFIVFKSFKASVRAEFSSPRKAPDQASRFVRSSFDNFAYSVYGLLDHTLFLQQNFEL